MGKRSGEIRRSIVCFACLLCAIPAGCRTASNPAQHTPPPVAPPARQVAGSSTPALVAPQRRVVKAKGGPRPQGPSPATENIASRPISLQPVAGPVAATPVPPPPAPAELRAPSASEIAQLRQTIRRVAHEGLPLLPVDDAAIILPPPDKSAEPARTQDTKPKPVVVEKTKPSSTEEQTQPTIVTNTPVAKLGLAQVLVLAGAENWAVLLADERIREAQAQYDAAKVLWLPSLNAGLGYSKHDGRIQDTRGGILDVSRNSLFLGGGAVTADAPTAAGSGGPARMFIDLSLADAIFKPRSAGSLLCASQFARHATFNDTLLEASLAYYDVVRAQQQLALARENLELTKDLLKDIKRFEASGKGTKGDVSRVEVQVDRRDQDVVRGDIALKVAAAELARVLRINLEGPGGDVAIYANESKLVPVDFIPTDAPLQALTSQAVTNRPEIGILYHRSEAAQQNAAAEQWRPWIPNLHAGLSAGGFGGGRGGRFNSLSGRADFDVLAIWQVRNLGLGMQAARDRTLSIERQTQLEYHRARDIIIAEVAKALAEVKGNKRRMTLAHKRVEKALDAHSRSLSRIRGFVGLPLEALQDVQAVIEAKRELVEATIDYNNAQLKLLRAVGRSAQ